MKKKSLALRVVELQKKLYGIEIDIQDAKEMAREILTEILDRKENDDENKKTVSKSNKNSSRRTPRTVR